MKNIFYCMVLIVMASCSKEKEQIAIRADYDQYLSNVELASARRVATEINFWKNRLRNITGDEASVSRLASLYAQEFKETGSYDDIRTSDSLYRSLLSKERNNVEILQALAVNAITQHQFQTARDYIVKAAAIGNKKAASLLILADVCLEMGDDAQASFILKSFRNKNSFAFLIRQAKLKDREGKLDTAIMIMEKADRRVRGNAALMDWTKSNLGDMYGHAGRIDDAYSAYLEALKLNPANTHALKGIAWIALSNDHNIAEARRIIGHLASRSRMPEAHLLLSEVEALASDDVNRLSHIKRFVEMASAPGYRTMYHKYLAIIEAEDLNNPEACLSIADEEIMSRPTAESYDLRAWGLYNLKDYRQALKIAREHVEEQTSEPLALYHLGMICLANGERSRAEKYLKKALSSQFELGPHTTKRIKEALSTL